MNAFDIRDIERPFTVTVTRPSLTTGDDGNAAETFETVAEDLPADIQLSLRVRNVVAEDGTGASDNTAWMLYAVPPVPILAGDRVSDGSRTFRVEAAGDWGSHTECVMTRVGG